MYEISSSLEALEPTAQDEGGDDPARSQAGLTALQLNIQLFMVKA